MGEKAGYSPGSRALVFNKVKSRLVPKDRAPEPVGRFVRPGTRE